MLCNKLKDNFISKNVVNLSRSNFTDSEISLLSKGLNFLPTFNTIDKSNLVTQFEALGRILRLKQQFRNEVNDSDLDQIKSKSIFSPCNKDGATEIYMSTLEETLMKIEKPKDKYYKLYAI